MRVGVGLVEGWGLQGEVGVWFQVPLPLDFALWSMTHFATLKVWSWLGLKMNVHYEVLYIFGKPWMLAFQHLWN